MAHRISKQEANILTNALIARSSLFIVTEFRGYKAETIKYTDKKTGRAMEFSRLVFNVESKAESADPMVVSFNVPEGYIVKDVAGTKVCMKDGTNEEYDPGCKKGDQIICVVDSCEKGMGLISFRGTAFHPIDKDEIPVKNTTNEAKSK